MKRNNLQLFIFPEARGNNSALPVQLFPSNSGKSEKYNLFCRLPEKVSICFLRGILTQYRNNPGECGGDFTPSGIIAVL